MLPKAGLRPSRTLVWCKSTCKGMRAQEHAADTSLSPLATKLSRWRLSRQVLSPIFLFRSQVLTLLPMVEASRSMSTGRLMDGSMKTRLPGPACLRWETSSLYMPTPTPILIAAPPTSLWATLAVSKSASMCSKQPIEALSRNLQQTATLRPILLPTTTTLVTASHRGGKAACVWVSRWMEK